MVPPSFRKLTTLTFLLAAGLACGASAGAAEPIPPLDRDTALLQITHTNMKVREHALTRLIALSDVSLLGEVLARQEMCRQTSSPEVRARLDQLLASFQTSPGAKELIRLVEEDERAAIRTGALILLESWQDPARKEVFTRRALHDPWPLVRAEAVEGLSQFPDPSVIPTLLTVLDKDREVIPRYNALVALAGRRDPRLLPAFLNALNDREEAVRRAAMVALSMSTDPQVVPALLTLAVLPQSAKRVTALAALHPFVRAPGAMPLLLRSARDPDADIRRTAVNNLIQLNDAPLLPLMISLLKHDDDPEVKLLAIEGLSRFTDPAITPLLVDLVRQPSPSDDIREAAARSLGRMTGTDARAALLTLSRDPDPAVRRASTFGLETSPHVLAHQALRELLLRDAATPVRIGALVAICQSPSIDAVPLLTLALRDPDYLVRATALINLGDRMSLPLLPLILEKISDPEPMVRMASMKVLFPFRDPQVVLAYFACLTDEDETIREMAGECPQDLLFDPRAFPLLVKHLGHSSPRVRVAAVTALGRIGGLPALAEITPLLNDPDPGVRQAAREAREALGEVESFQERRR